MRVNQRIVSAGIATMLTAAVLPLPADATQTAAPQVTVEGVIEGLADEGAGAEVAVRLPGGERIPLTTAGPASGGDRVRVTVPVPVDVTAAVSAGRAVGTDGNTVRVSRSELRHAAQAPAAASSPLAKATVADALADGRTVAPGSVQVMSKASVARGVGVHSVTVALVTPKGVKGTSATTSQVAAQVRGADAYWRAQSGGTIGLNLASVSRPYASAFSCRDNAFSLWSEAARATGFTDGPGKHLVMVFPREATKAGCSYGLASMGRSTADGGVVYVSDTLWPVLAHEIGHNFGLAHAKGLRCASVTDTALTQPLRSGCTIDEYGDPYDVMSASSTNGAGSLSMPQAVRIGLAGARDYVDVTGGTRTVTLKAVSTHNGVRAARVRDPRNGAVYWVEYRTRTGGDAKLYMPMTPGVRILREESGTTWPGTVALDASPTGSGNDSSWNLPAGSLFTSYGGGVGVSLVSVRGDTATVSVSSLAAGRTLRGARAGVVARTSSAAARTPAPAAPSVSISGKGVVSWRTSGRSLRYDAVIRSSTGGPYGRQRTWYAKTTKTSALLRAPRGTTVQVRVRAHAGATAGAWSGWSAVAFR